MYFSINKYCKMEFSSVKLQGSTKSQINQIDT
jgi:hypothetical protein